MNSLGMITSGIKLSPVVCGCFWSCFYASVCVSHHVGLMSRLALWAGLATADCVIVKLILSTARVLGSHKRHAGHLQTTHTHLLFQQTMQHEEFGEIRFRLVLISQSSTLSEKKVQKLSLGLYLFKR